MALKLDNFMILPPAHLVSDSSRPSNLHNRRGFSLLEVLLSMTILTISAVGLAGFIDSSSQARKSAQSNRVARDQLAIGYERLTGLPFEEVFSRYNGTTSDDPGTGSSPGSVVPVSTGSFGWTSGEGAPPVLTVELPTTNAAPGVLREDLNLPELGLPRDLNLDGVIDSSDHSADYQTLPVLLTIRWTERGEMRQLEQLYLLTSL